jgi:hypothetical protein
LTSRVSVFISAIYGIDRRLTTSVLPSFVSRIVSGSGVESVEALPRLDRRRGWRHSASTVRAPFPSPEHQL